MGRFIEVPVFHGKDIIQERINIDLITSYVANPTSPKDQTCVEIGGKWKTLKMPLKEFEDAGNNDILRIKLG